MVSIKCSTILVLVLWQVVGTGGYPISYFGAQYRPAFINTSWIPISPNHIMPSSVSLWGCTLILSFLKCRNKSYHISKATKNNVAFKCTIKCVFLFSECLTGENCFCGPQTLIGGYSGLNRDATKYFKFDDT